ncbi:MAG: allophanate hydrolase [Akkermansiaceae bacterium]|jgi:allophanate hydrolase|nr:allophanate hydrolase [Akkermansiaceae bacterium]MDP4647320.1 allophanate hydrolase [Akkermansiaceae bacterium]MDP4722376.1 allophanate hydrolase [Akkermansiaceae bacterium]MDP4779472.1 allophanate hydrolase [Akkermansiaceae bacterium]MDP4847474.1 allophanate hydrolase [Akkermansiaceae bacterium]
MKTIRDFKKAYADGRNVEEVLRGVWETIRDDNDGGIFILKASWEDVLAQIEGLDSEAPLYGVPFVAKDNIDVKGMPTTAACPEFSYDPEEPATVIRLLQEAGAVCFGKTNLDQFATGLVGVRTPHGAPKNGFDEEYLPGGSSCGSAIAVAKGLVAFSLGTDTAGSGRVPAAFNDLIGLKPSLGYISTRGVVDACKSLDCVSVFAHTCDDADEVLLVAGKYDAEEAWSRKPPEKWKRFSGKPKMGVPRRQDLQFFGWDAAEDLFDEAIEQFEGLDAEVVEISLEPFLKAAKLLYEGPWVTERYVGIREFIETKPEAVFPVTRQITEGGKTPLASDFFEARYKLAECKRLADQEMAKVDFIITPTTPRNYKVAEVLAEPVKLNSILGTYTNFMNLLDYSALALPAGMYEGRLPWGVTIFAHVGMDRALLELGSMYEQMIGRQKAAYFGLDGFDEVPIVVCGAHLEGMPLNWQLTKRGGTFLAKMKTEDCYRMYLVPAGDGMPDRPALVRVGKGQGVAIDCEVWSLSTEAFGDFTSMIPAPLGIGKVLMQEGVIHCGFIAEAIAMEGARDISEFGGWRGYVASLQ